MEKIKLIIKNCLESEKGKDILTVVIVILVGLGSFELGRLSKENSSSGIKILSDNTVPSLENSNILQNDVISTTANSNSINKTFFASNRGSKYYPISCSAGKTIKQENRVWFATGEEAERAGYELSSACQ
ncbi:MAG: hypothetical protein UU13_C0008G0012 [Candidatus Nomurabacteria bacterium GW2011_GWB1_40_7]|uniref:Uncharacterized protein n=1 Tax=Candidatus Nomurabacteria bacterium GW2011_GWB1_40_7 TaxID=1618744 RepID=A0A0G0T6G4_9BACT|nr:MAG: hypothetical protein UU13_C0008G0012 [Candidatus Nomurabacteria bacterium GW2011_GWB1_40_7]